MHAATPIQRLILLWAFIEGGIGGILHLLQFPFTGLLVGGLAVITNILLAHYSGYRRSVMLSALGTVLAAKFALSPHASVGAYVAVGFQGLLAAFLFPAFRLRPLVVGLYTVLCMLESGLQKPIMATILFGKALWLGMVELLHKVFLTQNQAWVVLGALLALYLMIYLAWGILLARWALALLRETPNLQHRLPDRLVGTIPRVAVTRKRSQWLYYFGLLILLAIALSFVWHSSQSVGWYLLRVAVVLLLLQLLTPLALRLNLGGQRSKVNEVLPQLKATLPLFQIRTRQAVELAKRHRGMERIKFFIFYFFYLHILYDDSTDLHPDRSHSVG